MRVVIIRILLCMTTILRARSFANTFTTVTSVRIFSNLASSINGADDPASPKTGWNHNIPDSESDFWEPGPEKYKRPPKQPEHIRTGWLHNTEPKEKRERKEASDTLGGTSTSPARRRLEIAMKEQERNHRIVSAPTFHATGTSCMVVTEHVISVPLQRPNKQPRVDVFFTVLEKIKDENERQWFEYLNALTPQKRAREYVEHGKMENADGMLLYLQGGPGFGAPPPAVRLGLGKGSSWASKALETYQRVVLMDQRGTGRSSPVIKQTLERKFPNLFLLDDKEADKTLEDFESSHPGEYKHVKDAVDQVTAYLANFRADNIVMDAEEIRDALLVPTETEGEPQRPWGCSLGQSFGGFCQMTYLSQIAYPPKVMLFTGGIAPMLTPTYDVYTSLWKRVKERSLLYYEMYPSDIPLVKKIVRLLMDDPVSLPSGGKLTARRFLQLGLALGGSPSSFPSLHSLFESALIEHDDGTVEFRRSFLKEVESEQNFDDAPFYFWLHESIYADGRQRSPTSWAAHRAYEDLVKSSPEFDYRLTCLSDSPEEPVLFFGEMVFPFMCEDFGELRGVGLHQVAEALASKSDWGPLYDADHMKMVLGESRTKAAAVAYHGDMYVDFNSCMKVVARGAPLEKVKVWITNDYQHSGLRDDGATIFEKLLGMARGALRTPS